MWQYGGAAPKRDESDPVPTLPSRAPPMVREEIMTEDMLQSEPHAGQPHLLESGKASWKKVTLEQDFDRWGWGRHSRWRTQQRPRPRDVVEHGVGSRQR